MGTTTNNTDSSHSPSVSHYVKIWFILLVILGVSLLLGGVGASQAMIAGIFGLAVVKAILVISQFMHIGVEPKFIIGMLLGGLLILVFLYVGTVLDVTIGYSIIGES